MVARIHARVPRVQLSAADREAKRAYHRAWYQAHLHESRMRKRADKRRERERKAMTHLQRMEAKLARSEQKLNDALFTIRELIATMASSASSPISRDHAKDFIKDLIEIENRP